MLFLMSEVPCRDAAPSTQHKERSFIGFMTLDHKLEASREGSKCRIENEQVVSLYEQVRSLSLSPLHRAVAS